MGKSKETQKWQQHHHSLNTFLNKSEQQKKWEQQRQDYVRCTAVLIGT
jgi:hypothetical protein